MTVPRIAVHVIIFVVRYSVVCYCKFLVVLVLVPCNYGRVAIHTKGYMHVVKCHHHRLLILVVAPRVLAFPSLPSSITPVVEAVR